MVIWPGHELCLTELISVVQPADPVLERLDPPRRAAVVMALIAIALIGLVLVACVMLGANWVRRMARDKPRTSRTECDPRSAAKDSRPRRPLREPLLPVDTKDTVDIDPKSGPTKADR